MLLVLGDRLEHLLCHQELPQITCATPRITPGQAQSHGQKEALWLCDLGLDTSLSGLRSPSVGWVLIGSQHW